MSRCNLESSHLACGTVRALTLLSRLKWEIYSSSVGSEKCWALTMARGCLTTGSLAYWTSQWCKGSRAQLRVCSLTMAQSRKGAFLGLRARSGHRLWMTQGQNYFHSTDSFPCIFYFGGNKKKALIFSWILRAFQDYLTSRIGSITTSLPLSSLLWYNCLWCWTSSSYLLHLGVFHSLSACAPLSAYLLHPLNSSENPTAF